MTPEVTPEVTRPVRRRGPRTRRCVALTARRRQVLALLAQGASRHAIGRRLGISPKTVELHRADLYLVTGIDHLPGLTLYALRLGLIDADGQPASE